MLEARALRCERGGRELFRALSFSLAEGELVRIAGGNGSGKTSLVRILARLLMPTEGAVLWRGADIAGLGEDYSRELLYVGHAAGVKEELTATENLSIACRLAGDRAPDIAQALARFGLSGSALPIRRLSQGQQRRAALARLALSEARRLWLLDEPFSALDAEGLSVLKALILEHKARGGAIVLTTHQDAGIAATRVVELG